MRSLLGYKTRSWQITLRVVFPIALSVFLLMIPGAAAAQKKRRPAKASNNQSKPANELARLREEFIKATNDYKANLEKLRAIYEKNVLKAEERLAQSKDLFAAGLISKNQLEAAERAVAEAKDKVTEVNQRLTTADTQIADTLLEAKAETQLTKLKPGSTLRTAAYIRYNGPTA